MNKEIKNLYKYLKTSPNNKFQKSIGEELDSIEYFNFAEFIPEQWLVHITDIDWAEDILKNGFIYGTPNMKRLGLTRNSAIMHLLVYNEYLVEEKTFGYNFAFTINDFFKYGNNFKYGESIILLKSPGVRVWHNGDHEYQTIFWGKDATDIRLVDCDEGNGKLIKDGSLLNLKSYDTN